MHVVLCDFFTTLRVGLNRHEVCHRCWSNHYACGMYSHVARITFYFYCEVEHFARILIALVEFGEFRHFLHRSFNGDGEALLAEWNNFRNRIAECVWVT